MTLDDFLLRTTQGGRIRRSRPESGALLAEFAAVLPRLAHAVSGADEFGTFRRDDLTLARTTRTGDADHRVLQSMRIAACALPPSANANEALSAFNGPAAGSAPRYGTNRWWKTADAFSRGTLTDPTTWSVQIVGNPVRLVPEE